MYPLYQDGDKVLILRQSTLNRSGDVGAIVYVDQYEYSIPCSISAK